MAALFVLTFLLFSHGERITSDSTVDRGIGSPFSLPGALAAWLRTGRPPAEYESLYMTRPFRVGDGDRLFREDGWGPPEAEDDVAFRRVVRDSAGLVAPLHRPAAYRLGVRWRSTGSLRTRVIVNDSILGSSEVSRVFQDSVLDVPAACLFARPQPPRLSAFRRG